MFTQNKMTAAPVVTTNAHLTLTGGQAAAVVLNSGCANAATGPPGVEDAQAMCAAVAAELGCLAEEVLVCSTGLIGYRLPMDAILAGIPKLVAARSADGGADAAEAMRTTDTHRKETLVAGDGFRVGGMAKGAAMLAPNMATMLAVLTTDAAVDPSELTDVLRAAVGESFNAMSVDGCTSTNDTVILLASGAAGRPADPAGFRAAVAEACLDLATQMVGDAEGHTKVVEVRVTGALSDDDARAAARQVAESQLVKCSWYGQDPVLGPRRERAGHGRHHLRARQADRALRRPRRGRGRHDGAGRRAGPRRLHGPRAPRGHRPSRSRGRRPPASSPTTSPTPTSTRTWAPRERTREHRSAAEARAAVLVEALPYIQRFRGRVVVVKYGGNAMVDPALATSFAEDIVLMHSVGLRPVVVHGGGPQISDLMERLGKVPEFRDGQRVTDAETVDIARMVLVGKVNRDIVGSINVHGPLAVGVSGEDAGLIRAEARHPDLGFVGDVEAVNPSILERLLAEELIPVVSTIGADASGQAYNINADAVAGALAEALAAEKVIYLTDVEGLLADLDDPGSLISHIDAKTLQALLDDGALSGGMIPKIAACLHAVAGGVGSAHLLDGRLPHVVLLELFSDAGVGTMITAEPDMTAHARRPWALRRSTTAR